MAQFDLPEGVGGLLTQFAVQGAQRQQDGASAYAENLRYDYLIAKGRVDFAQATGIRYVEESGSGRVRTLDPNAIKSA